MTLGITGDADLREAVVRRQRRQQRERVGKQTRRLARIARDHEHVLDAGVLQRHEDLPEFHPVVDEASRKVRHRVVTELRQRDREMDRPRHAAAWRCGDGDSHLARHVRGDQLGGIVGGKDLVTGRAQQFSRRSTLRTKRLHHAHLRCRTIRHSRALRNTIFPAYGEVRGEAVGWGMSG